MTTKPYIGMTQKQAYELGLAEAVRWRPIETAPRDEMLLLAKEFFGPGDWRIKVGHRNTGEDWKVFGASWTPSHWMPLPAPPKEPT